MKKKNYGGGKRFCIPSVGVTVIYGNDHTCTEVFLQSANSVQRQGKADIVIPVAFYFTSVEQFQAWINDQTGNTAATPYTAKFRLDLAAYENILNEIEDKYVALEFSGATGTTFSPSYSATNRDKIV